MDSGDCYWGVYRDYYRDPFPHSLLSLTSNFVHLCNVIKKPWVFMRAPYMNPTIRVGYRRPGFLKQLPTFTLGLEARGFRGF